MDKIFKLEGLGCAHCAAKMERKLSKMKQVEQVTVNFMAAKMHMSLREDTPEVRSEIEKIVHKIERNVVVKEVS